jgi:mono/diheme cytochrome c family protein
VNYPIWDLPVLGGGILIGMVAILHVFVSHFAVGGGLFLALEEGRARREGDAALLAYVRGHSRFLALVTLVFGALSGVGIWWTIGLVHPSATSTLIHVFVWCWAIEWVFFLVEIAAAYVYYHGWDRLDARTHQAVGWIYFGSAWMSLFVINGILTFMLTPGRWLQTRALVDGFFNPTFLPSLLIRSAVCVALAGLYALLTAAAVESRELRHSVTRRAAGWVLCGIAPLPVLGVWYVAVLPPLAREISMGGAPAVTLFAAATVMLSLLLVGITWFGPYRRPQWSNAVLVAVIAVLGLGVTGATEWVREAVRKPYVLYGYMYSNSIRVEDAAVIRERGALRSAKWASLDTVTAAGASRAGYELFRMECRACHTVDGYNGIRTLVKGWSYGLVDHQLAHLNELKGFMPPFVGTTEERKALALWLTELGRERPFSDPWIAGSGPAPSHVPVAVAVPPPAPPARAEAR